MSFGNVVHMAGQMSTRSRHSNHFDLSIKPSVQVEHKLKSDISRRLDQDIIEELEHILLKSGYGGLFTLIILGIKKGTPHTRGIHFKDVRSHGIGMTLHGSRGGNGSNFEALLLKPKEFDALNFFTTLQQTKHALDLEEDCEQPTRTERLDESKTPEKSEAVAISLHVPLKATMETEAPIAPVVRWKLEDEVSQQLFLDELRKYVDSGQQVSYAVVSSVLTREFGIRPKGVGSVLRSLCNHKVLTSVPETGRPMDSMFQLPEPPSPAEPTVIPVVPVVVESPVPILPAATVRRPEEAKLPEGLTARFDQLRRRAGVASSCKTRLSDIEAELESIKVLLIPLNRRREELSAEQKRLTAKLAEPDIAAAQKNFAEIKKLLGG